jgi:hypothetical protein
MTRIFADKLPPPIQRLNRKLKEKGYEIHKRRASSSNP